VEIRGSRVTVTDEGTYILRGQLTDGQILVDADKEDKIQLVLDGAAVTCKNGAALHIKTADKVFVTLAELSENSLTSQQLPEGDSVDAALFSKEDITFNGTGLLTVTAREGHGIVSKDSLRITNGSYRVTAANHGIQGKDDICVTQANLEITAGKDGLHSENKDDETLGYVYVKDGTIQITAEGDGISAQSTLQLDGGSLQILTGGGSVNGQKKSSDHWGGFGGGRPGMRPGTPAETTQSEDSTSLKGLKAGGLLVINGGDYTLDTADDAVHCNGDLTVTGGSFTIKTGDDGFHADGTLQFLGGTATIHESYEGMEALHVQVSGGAVTLTASDDGINAAGGKDESGFGGRDPFDNRGGGRGWGGMSAGNGSITISGGTLHITSSGDGFDANGTLEITGGHITVCGPTRGDTATLDFDRTGTISGGTFVGTGAAGGMAQTFSQSEQAVITLRTGNQPVGTELVITDSSGKELLRYTPALDFGILIYSSPALEKGASYTVTIGNTPTTTEAK